MVSPPTSFYAGDISVQDAWGRLKADPRAQLIDVRTRAEWNFVGIPDLGELGRRVVTIEWQTFPDGAPNPDFVAQATAATGGDSEAPLLMMCRSGGRSRAAAMALTAAGFKNSFNIAGGFEGDLDAAGHRGTVNGWKAAGLPWRQG